MSNLNIFGEYNKPTKNIKTNKKETKPWVDKYRPSKLKDVVYQTEIINMLNQTLETGDLPHLLLYGPPGTGKTSTILALAKELYGKELYKSRVFELNASDERGINIVREKIVRDAKTAISTKKTKGHLCPAYKIIILDEADAMTTDAQSALRKVMEDYSSITRFCFICNYINKIIEPIASRCVKFRFKPLETQAMINKIKDISKKENLKLKDNIIETIVEIAEGDMRKAITFLQNIGYVSDYKNKELTCDDVYDAANHITKKDLSLIWNNTVKIKKTSPQIILKLTKTIISKGYPIHNILYSLIKRVIFSPDLSDCAKSKLSLCLSESEKYIIEGGDEFLQLLNIFSKLVQYSKI
tara:strand:- start:317 stop:1381 length:1065 start_codon:yes stop_codon:yes gene_type:complete